ncbi:uncharacterized protein PHACADRAFT_116020 [Phanerochaete carnosa HHB-10118-sp]|uniref:DUF4110 domain-containing protein n=1 Tax=Phanerochaete carnosa (strain HHB-10118-sp) TaxID=650164 RepID=K5WEM6_PHACS|nr:uncharacterized protein PHACADRAFT_116020 [Phanerochaete carnosa HHB-10118-sp]EKM57740.1 hypothetical protein PHACADRAFT_116020 [Phanerochaete carnosa HHB-10118-sp]
MAKKKAGNSGSKASAKAAKKAKIDKKIDRKEKKKQSKSKPDIEDDDEDLEAILDKMRRDWEDQHKVTEELVEGPPSRRANATLIPCPNGNHLWCIGGEFFSEDNKAYFYNDVFRYSPDKDEWRKFVSPTCPGPRSAHAVVASPAGGGKLFLFGGEFSSLNQSTFHHYRDFWCFDIQTHSWDRIETKVLPSARSGHRMAMWKHYIVLFGGFYDPGIRTNYLNDLWLFDTQEYKWKQVELKENEPKPSPRSGFSFLSTPEGALLHGGYCKEYQKGKRPVGVMLEDTWFLRLSVPTEPDADRKPSSFNMPVLKWERRKRSSTAYAPSIRSGCTMALWQTKNTGVLFGGVTDEDTNEETLESVFHNDLYGYQIAENGRWISITLKRPKQKGGAKKKMAPAATAAPKLSTSVSEKEKTGSDDEKDSDEYHSDEEDKPWLKAKQQRESRPPSLTSTAVTETPVNDEVGPEDPNLTIPLPRYNAMLAVLRNNLFIYGGIFERGSREYTLDDFYLLQLDKLDRYVCLKPSDVIIPANADDSSSDGDDDEDSSDDESNYGDGDDDDESLSATLTADSPAKEVKNDKEDGKEMLKVISEEEPDPDNLRAQATAFMGVSKDQTRSAEDVVSTPLPGETLAMFYARSRDYWAQKAHQSSDNRGKMLRRDAFTLAQERYTSYKPILTEVEKILAEAGMDEEEIRRSAAAGPDARQGQSRNRR